MGLKISKQGPAKVDSISIHNHLINYLSNSLYIRNLVSKQRRRMLVDGYDLDMSYITDRVLAMSFPAERMRAMYRNPLWQVKSVLDMRHQDHYKVPCFNQEPPFFHLIYVNFISLISWSLEFLSYQHFRIPLFVFAHFKVLTSFLLKKSWYLHWFWKEIRKKIFADCCPILFAWSYVIRLICSYFVQRSFCCYQVNSYILTCTVPSTCICKLNSMKGWHGHLYCLIQNRSFFCIAS